MAKEPKKPSERRKGSYPARGGAPVQLDDIKFQLVCEEMARTGSKYKSCEAVGFHYHTVIDAIKVKELAGDTSWREAWNMAYDQFRDSLADEATRRARDGAATKFRMNPRTGELTPIEVEYSDQLMGLLLKGHFPERFRDNIHVSGTVGLQPVDLVANLSSKAKLEIRQIILRDLEEQRQAGLAAEGQVIENQPRLEHRA